MATVTSTTRKLNPTSNTYETNLGLTVGTNIVVGGTVDGRDIASDGSKLDGIEASADVTDSTNVVAALTAGSNITIASNGTISSTNTNTQLSNEQVQDIVGAMLSGNSVSGITVTYQDTDGTIDFSVASQTDQNFTNADHTKLNGIATGADVTPSWVPSSDPSYATQSYVGTQITNLIDSAPSALDTLNELAAALGDDANFSTTITNSIASKQDTLTAGSNITISGGTISATNTNTQLSNEQVQDIVGAMLSGNTESGITVTYDDTNNEIDFTVASQTDQNFTNADHTKLNGIETGATADQTAAEIRAWLNSRLTQTYSQMLIIVS